MIEDRMNCKPAIQLWLEGRANRIIAGLRSGIRSEEVQLMERVVVQGNMLAAYKQVKRNGESPGIDGMTVKELGAYLREHWLSGRLKPRVRSEDRGRGSLLASAAEDFGSL